MLLGGNLAQDILAADQKTASSQLLQQQRPVRISTIGIGRLEMSGRSELESCRNQRCHRAQRFHRGRESQMTDMLHLEGTVNGPSGLFGRISGYMRDGNAN